jgi:hypothetical protein
VPRDDSLFDAAADALVERLALRGGDCAQALPAASNVSAIAQIKSECRFVEHMS